MRKSLTALLFALIAASVGASARADQGTPRPRAHHALRRAKITAPSARARGLTVASKSPTSQPAHADSIGSPNEGKLAGGVHLDTTKPFLHVVPMYDSGDLRWGLPEMIRMIERGAKNVAKRYPGAVLDVGDISKKGGGDVLRHHSHESGRDADLGFYALDAKGKQIHARIFVKFDQGTLESSNVPGARFDLARNWLLIQELLTDPVAHVSHIFIEARLREHVLAYARTHAASRAIADRAALVMMQPHHSLPHDDHIHVRISCPSSMRGECVELAKGALNDHSRMAQRGHAKPGRTVIHTPRHHVEPKPPPAMGAAPQDDDDFVDTPAGAPEIDTDGADARRSVDETGTTKIID